MTRPFHAMLVLALAAACGGRSDIVDPSAARVPAAVRIGVDSVLLRAIGATQAITVSVHDSAGAVIDGVEVALTTTDMSVATVSESGSVRAAGDGEALIIAAAGPVLRDTAIVRVDRTVASVRLTPSKALLVGRGHAPTMSAAALDGRGHEVLGREVTWSVTEPSVAVIDGAGGVRAVASGRTTVRAAIDGVAGAAAVSVMDTTGSGVRALDLLVAGLFDRLGVPGAAVAVAHQGRLVHARGYGLADTIARTLYSPSSITRIASVSKSMTSAGVIRLAEAGVLDLDDRVFVDWLADLLPAGGPADPRLLDVTIRQLMQHTGGWNQPPNDPMFTPGVIAAWAGIPGPPDAETIIRHVATRPLQFAPGTQRYYSNVGYVMLGRVIERATGTDYVSWMRSLLGARGITSLGLARSLASQRAAGEVVYHAGGAEDGLFQSVFPSEPGRVPFPYGAFAIEPLDAGGGLVSSVTDLVRFLLAVDGRQGDDIITQAGRTQLGVDTGLPGNLANYGSGWFRIGSVWYHLGRVPGMMSAVVMDDTRDIVFAVVLNFSEPTAAFQNDVANSMLQAVQAILEWPAGDLFTSFP